MIKFRKRTKLKSVIAAALALSVGVTTMGLSVLAEVPSGPPSGGGGSVAATSYDGKYYTDYETMADAKKAAEELTREIAQEGDVLLKNNGALPLRGNEWVSVLGVTSDAMIGASDKAGAFSGSSAAGDSTLVDALSAAGFKVNPSLKTYYENDSSDIGDETTKFNGVVKESLKVYDDVAFIVISREGGEGSDASRVTEEQVDDDDFEHKALFEGENFKTVDKEQVSLGTGTWKHSLMLTKSEKELIALAKAQFKKVVVITNTSNPIEINSLKNDDEIDAIVHIGRPGVGGLDGLADILKGAVSPSGGLVDEWMVDFTADPVWYNFGNNNQTKGYNGAAGSSAYMNSNGEKTGTEDSTNATKYEGGEGYYGVDYEEGIYLGYKYYETVYTEIAEGNLTYNVTTKALTAEANTGADKVTSANQWWTDNVAYPYGYGLSYTSFSFNADKIYTDKACTVELGATVAATQFNSSVGAEAVVKKLYVPVTVKNTGAVAGKKTVQVYVTAPYTNGGIEKSAVTLVGFAKSGVLSPNQEQTVVVEFNVQDMASWDSTAENVGSKGHYVLDAGEYKIRVMENSHYDYATDVTSTTDAYDEIVFTLSEKADLKLDDYSGNEVKNLFTTGDNDVSSGAAVKVDDLNYGNVRTADMMATGGTAMTVLSRSNLVATFPEAPKASDLKFKDNVLANWAFWDNYVVSDIGVNGDNGNVIEHDTSKSYYDREGTDTSKVYNGQTNYVNDKATDPWYKSKEEVTALGWTQAEGEYDANHKVQNNRTTKDFPMYVSKATEDTIKYTEMYGVPYDDDKWDDFLDQLTYDELCTVVEFGGYSTVDIASVGKIKTEDSDGPNNWDSSHCWCSEDIIASTFNVELAEKQGKLMGNLGLLKDPTSTQTGWYAPGADIHRSPFSGRNNEYYSQDSLHSGYMAAAVIQGVQSKGIVCYVKHCFMNDQETNRGNLFTWATEQSMRESYTKSFQMALQEGGSSGAMVGYGRLGGISNTNNYNLNTELYQNQWGTQACFVTDGYIGWRIRTSPDMMVRAGNVFELYTTPFVEYLSGEWNAEKGTVMIGETESYTQWYCVRMCAKSVLYNHANTVAQRNGYSELNIMGRELAAASTNVAYEANVAIDSMINDDSYAKAAISGGALPEGLELDPVTSTISGTPEVAGNYRFTVQYTIDGFITKTANYSIKVDPALKLDDEGDAIDQAKVGQEFMTQIVSDVFTTVKYSKIEYKLKEGSVLPAGLTLSANGEISGTPTAAGTYNVVIVMEATENSSGGGGGGKMFAQKGSKVGVVRNGNKGESTPTVVTVELALTFVVTGEGGSTGGDQTNIPYIGENGNWYINGVDTGKPSQGAAGEKGDKGDNGVAGAASGCGGVVGVGSAIAAAVAVLGGAALVLRKKKED